MSDQYVIKYAVTEAGGEPVVGEFVMHSDMKPTVEEIFEYAKDPVNRVQLPTRGVQGFSVLSIAPVCTPPVPQDVRR